MNLESAITQTVDIISILVLGSLCTSCKKDKEKSPEELLIGSWNEIKIETVWYSNNGSIDHTVIQTFAEGELVLEFLDDGTVYLYDKGDHVVTFTWQLDGKNLIWNSHTIQFTLTESILNLIFEIPPSLLNDGTYGPAIQTHTAIRSSD